MSIIARRIIPIIAHYRRFVTGQSTPPPLVAGSIVVCKERFDQASVTDEAFNQAYFCKEEFNQAVIIRENLV